MIDARLIAVSQPTIDVRIPNTEALVSYCARVSSPDNQEKFDTAEKLLRYCMKNHHWSVFEMASATVEVTAPRDISRQMLRHRSFSFQEFSQRYSDQISFTMRDVRMQDHRNRQNSTEIDDPDFIRECQDDFYKVVQDVADKYEGLLADGVAKECARVILPEGLTMSKMYVNGTLRSWIHYLQVREGNGTQKEHILLANKIREVLKPAFPTVFKALEDA
jgi:thymidylate synthase (FAD)